MQNQVQQLLADLLEACQNAPQSYRKAHGVEKRLEQALEKAVYQPLETSIGIPKDRFPDSKDLDDRAVEQLLAALLQLLNAYGYRVHFPDGVLVSTRYHVLTQYLDQETPQLENHYWQLPVCGYEPQTCQYGQEYCECAIWEQTLGQIASRKTKNPSPKNPRLRRQK